MQRKVINMNLLLEQIEKTKDHGTKTVRYILKEICKTSKQAEELILQDLTVPAMSLEKCFSAIYEYARKNKTEKCFSCAVFGIDSENEVIKIILDFYKIPNEWINANLSDKTIEQPIPQSNAKVSLLDLM